MKKGLILGKFYPLHKGHLSLFEFGAKNCDKLTVLVTKETNEKLDLDIRLKLVKDTVNRYLNEYDIEIIGLNYDDKDLPATSESSYDISCIWANKIKEILPDTNIIFGSEKYVEYLGQILNCQYQIYDINRTVVNISATKVRNNLFDSFKYLPYDVRKYFTKKIIILGSESTGKSTLTKLLADYYNTEYVPEVARDIIESSDDYNSDILIEVINQHTELIDKTVPNNNPLVFIDTDMHITQSYHYFKYNDYLFIPDNFKHHKIQKGDLYLYLDNNVPFIQDGTRFNDIKKRDLLDTQHRQTLRYFNVPYKIIRSHTFEGRLQESIDIINDFIKKITF